MKCRPWALYPRLGAHGLKRIEPARRKPALGSRVSDGMRRDAEPVANRGGRQGVGDGDDGWLVHAADLAKLFSNFQANNSPARQFSCQATLGDMSNDARPYADIAERLLWHRSLLGLSQAEYAEKLGVKRSAYSLWEAGSHRLSLNGALALRQRFGLSLDFMYAGIDDALPMTLRNAWLDRPSVKS